MAPQKSGITPPVFNFFFFFWLLRCVLISLLKLNFFEKHLLYFFFFLFIFLFISLGWETDEGSPCVPLSASENPWALAELRNHAVGLLDLIHTIWLAYHCRISCSHKLVKPLFCVFINKHAQHHCLLYLIVISFNLQM